MDIYICIDRYIFLLLPTFKKFTIILFFIIAVVIGRTGSYSIDLYDIYLYDILFQSLSEKGRVSFLN